jgi:predicted TIM-barrel fold metal-dependent hydrolase
VCGTDGTEFGCEWTTKALAEARIGEDARAKILHHNAAAMLSRLTKVAQREIVAA